MLSSVQSFVLSRRAGTGFGPVGRRQTDTGTPVTRGSFLPSSGTKNPAFAVRKRDD